MISGKVFEQAKKFCQTPKVKSPISILLISTLAGSCCFSFATYQVQSRSPWNKESKRAWGTHESILSNARDNKYFSKTCVLLATNAIPTGGRTYSTESDLYFKRFHKIPIPAKVHNSLDQMLATDNDQGRKSKAECNDDQASQKILIIGDVHGCLNELKSLVSKASRDYNNGKSFRAVVLCGDLCNKGPNSAKVIRYVRLKKNWFSVRGNHDNSGLLAALGDKKYGWVDELSDEDVIWMSDLPYTIRIPKNMLSEGCKRDVVVVHAGLIPKIELDEQEFRTMTTIREVVKESRESVEGDDANRSCDATYRYREKFHKGDSMPWAKMWTGPEYVVFGHDAKRGLQSEKFALGLDSGACYGKQLTGLVFPDMKIVSVDAEKVYCPIE